MLFFTIDIGIPILRKPINDEITSFSNSFLGTSMVYMFIPGIEGRMSMYTSAIAIKYILPYQNISDLQGCRKCLIP